MPRRMGVSNPWTEYVQFIPTESSLPIFWSDEEKRCLWGTSLENHLAAKEKALEREFADFQSATENVESCRHWWSSEGDLLSIEDWKVVDAMYRSRAMDLSQHGGCLVPVMDIANHADSKASKAGYGVNESNRDAHLTLEEGESVNIGDEVTISYAGNRGASESIYSYGFIEPNSSNAISLWLAMDPPEDDPLAHAKIVALNLKAGFKISMQRIADVTEWIGGFVWAMCINEQDGLCIRVAQTVDGGKELEFIWKGQKIADQWELEAYLRCDWLKDLFMLRGFSVVQRRIGEEIDARQKLMLRPVEEKVPEGIDNGSHIWRLAESLRGLEMRLLQKAEHEFDGQV